MKDFSIYITMDCWKFERGGFFQDTKEEEESVITYPHLRILPRSDVTKKAVHNVTLGVIGVSGEYF